MKLGVKVPQSGGIWPQKAIGTNSGVFHISQRGASLERFWLPPQAAGLNSFFIQRWFSLTAHDMCPAKSCVSSWKWRSTAMIPALGGRNRRLKSSRAVLTTEQVPAQPGLQPASENKKEGWASKWRKAIFSHFRMYISCISNIYLYMIHQVPY